MEFAGDFLDGHLADDTRARFEQHLTRCPPCERFFATYSKTPCVARTALGASMPPEVKALLREFLASERSRR